jgi:hypothetical protein
MVVDPLNRFSHQLNHRLLNELFLIYVKEMKHKIHWKSFHYLFYLMKNLRLLRKEIYLN